MRINASDRLSKRLKRDTTENGKITINYVIIIKNNKTKLANIPDFMLEL